MVIKAVLFDMGNTLVDSRTTGETFRKILLEKGHDVPQEKMRDAFKKYSAEPAPDQEVGDRAGISTEDFYVKYNNDILKHLALVDPDPDLGKYIFDRWFQVLHIFLLPNAESTISRLKERGIKVGIVTNGFRDEVEEVFAGLAIRPEDFDLVVGCNTTGFAKPNPAPFKFAMEKLGFRPEEIIFVGDSHTNDYLGSQNVGMFPLLYLPKREPPADDVRYIRDLAEILTFL